MLSSLTLEGVFLLIKSSGLKLNILGLFCNLIIYVFMKVNDILIMLKKDGWSLVATRGVIVTKASNQKWSSNCAW